MAKRCGAVTETQQTQHTIVPGTTGSSKTVLISDLMAQIREHGERCVVYDNMRIYTRSLYDPAGDALLNPLDARSPRDFDTMAAALIPLQKDTVDPFWVTVAIKGYPAGVW